jgi:hypothetical protein
MAITNFIPKIWAAQMQGKYWEETVFAPLVNRDYEGELSSGNKIEIAGVVPPAIKDYKAAGRTTSADAISDTGVELDVDQEKSFDFYVDDIDRVQAAGTMDQYGNSAGLALAEDADQFIGNVLVTGSTAIANTTAPTDGDAAFDIIADLILALNQNHVPKAGRIVAINSLFHRQLVGASSKLTNVNTSGDPMGLREATVGNLLGARIIVTENLPTVAKAQAVAFNRDTVAYVSQIQKVEALRAQDRFADRLRGLHVYGAKVVRPESTASFTAAA